MSSMPIADMTRGRTTTRWFRFVGLNTKGTPPMSAAKIQEDLDLAADTYDAEIIVTQETRWAWYWRKAIARALQSRRRRNGRIRTGATWSHSPAIARAAAAPVMAAQAVMWRADLLRRRKTIRRLLHKGARKISELRQLRGVLLQDRNHPHDDDMAFWAGTTHFVVGADEAGDGPIRKSILYANDLPRFDRWLAAMLKTGHPAIVELDGNIHKNSAAYDDLVQIIRKHNGRIIGTHGVEYLLVFHGTNGVRVDVREAWEIPVNRLNTDHEGRGITFRLRKPAPAREDE